MITNTKNLCLQKVEKEEAVIFTKFISQIFIDSWQTEDNKSNIENYVNEYFSLALIKSELENPSIIYFAVKINNQFAGYCKLQINLHPENFILTNPISICRLYVKQEFQNLSLGSLMINEALLIASREKCKTIWLGVWSTNQKAIQFYMRNGFKIFDKCNFIMGNDISLDYLMKRPV